MTLPSIRYAGILAGAMLVTGLIAAPASNAQTATNLNCNGCVGKKDIDDGAVTSNKIRNGAIKSKDLHAGAQPTAAENVFILAPAIVEDSPETVASIQFELQHKANIVAVATWQMALNDDEGGQCAITLNSTAYSEMFSNRAFDANVPGPAHEHPGAATGMFKNILPGNFIVRLVCLADENDAITVRRRSLTVLAVPKKLPTS